MKNKCEYCESDYCKEKELLNNGNGIVMVYIRTGALIMQIKTIDGEHNLKSIDIKYCPICGRKIGDTE